MKPVPPLTAPPLTTSLLAASLTLATMLTTMLASAAPAQARPAMAVDVETGAVIHHEEAFRPWAPASLTKLMTALVAFRAMEEGRATPETRVVLSERAAAEPASKSYWKVGTSVSLRDALEMLIVKSANDVATAIAETLGGSEAGFAAMMNAEARRIGMTGSNFENAHGLPDAEQITTAHDMAVLGRTIRREFPQWDPIFRLEAVDTGSGGPQLSYNLVLGRYAGADGMKTGFVCASGFNVVTSATRRVDGEERTIVAVVLGSPDQETRAEIAVEMMERGLTEPLPAETLATLKPYGDTVTRTDLRPEICTEAARANRYDGRDVEGRMVLDTDLITARVRPPITARIAPFPPMPAPLEKPVSMRGEDDPRGTSVTLTGDPAPGTPVPTMRPGEDAEDEVAGETSSELRPAVDAPDLPEVDATTTGSIAAQ